MRSKNKRYWLHPRWGVECVYCWSRARWTRGHRRHALALKYINIFLFRAYIDCPASIGPRPDLPHGGFGVVIGPDMQIGVDAIILHNVTIGHATPGPLLIGDRLRTDAGATILGPLKIGNDVTIGANTSVNFDVPDGAAVVGQKARVIPQASGQELSGVIPTGEPYPPRQRLRLAGCAPRP